MTTEVQEWAADAADADDEEMRTVAGMLGARRVAKAVDRLGGRLDAEAERSAEEHRATRGEVSALAETVAALADTVSGLAARLDRWESSGESASAAHAEERRERHTEVMGVLGELSAALGVLGEQVPAAVSPVLDVLRRQEEDGARFHGFVGAQLEEAGQQQAEAFEGLRAVVLGGFEQQWERGEEERREQGAAVAGVRALVAERFESSAAETASVRGALDVVRGEVGEVREAVDSAADRVTGGVLAVRDEVLADGAGREERQGEALREGLAGVRREVDQAAGICAGIAAAVDRTASDVRDARQAITAEAEATRALMHGAAEESARVAARLGEDQAAVAVRHHQEVTGEFAELRGRVDVLGQAAERAAKAAGESTGRGLLELKGSTDALGDLLASHAESTGAAVSGAVAAVEQTGAVLAARTEAAEKAMTGRTDRLCSMLAESGYAQDSAVVSLGRRMARVEDRTGLSREPVEV